MELLAPAGSLEKLRIAYRYGADAAYIGIRGFSLRSSADTIVTDSPDSTIADIGKTLSALKMMDGRPRKLYGTLNLFAHERDIQKLPAVLERLSALPLDALIVADIGLIDLVRRYLPEIELHLSTQANCTNRGAAALYHRLGFSRIVAARELTIEEIAAIKDAVPDLEIEVFVHGAMCMSYSGRCFLSSAMTGRSANRGDCAHSCRWNYALMEEKRPGEYYPIEEDGRFSTILSSRDLMLIDHLTAIREAGVDSVKIEGRMKSALYVAITTAAYRHAIDNDETTERWRSLLFELSHRAYTTGFLFGDEAVHQPASKPQSSAIRLMGVLRGRDDVVTGGHILEAKNAIYRDAALTALLPGGSMIDIDSPDLFDSKGKPVDRIIHGSPGVLRLPPSQTSPDAEDAILLKRTLAPIPGR